MEGVGQNKMNLIIKNNSILINKDLSRFAPDIFRKYTFGVRVSEDEYLCIKVHGYNIKHSYRIKINGQSKCTHEEIEKLRKMSNEDVKLLADYFKINKDNPYAVFYVIKNYKDNPISDLIKTQFPPADHSSPTLNLENNIMHGDIIFSVSDTDKKSSFISKWVRKFDMSMFSHTELVMENTDSNCLMIASVGLGGGYVIRNPKSYISNLDKGEHVAVYRPTKIATEAMYLNEEEITKIKKKKYSKKKILKILIQRILGVPTDTVTISDILYNAGTQSSLIGYK